MIAPSLRHHNVHAAWSGWSEDQTLHVVAVYINPFRYEARRKLFYNFMDAMRRTANVSLHVVEVAFGARPFEVTGLDEQNDVRLRTSHTLWLKENAINIGMSRLPYDWKYCAYVDGDFTFTRHDWALEAIHQLQHYPAVQLFSSYAHMSIDHRPIRNSPSFAYVYQNYPPEPGSDLEKAMIAQGTWCPGPTTRGHDHCHSGVGPTTRGATPDSKTSTTATGAKMPVKYRKLIQPGATGGAWAYRRDTFAALGGLLDTCVTGSADWHMAFGMTGEIVGEHPETQAFDISSKEMASSTAYGQSIRTWQERAFRVIKGNIGYVAQHATHGWHGPYESRSYGTRYQILQRYKFDPYVDLVRDHQGLWSWSGTKPRMEQEIAKYFTSRNEDSTEMGAEVPLL